MKTFSMTLILSGAMLMAMPAFAGTTTFDFANCGDTGSSSCSSDLGAYTVTVGSYTATAVAFSVNGTSSGPTTSSTITSAEVGSYSGNGLGICESQSGDNCDSPNHQIDNGANTTLSGGNGSGTDSYEFLLISFGAAVNLNQVTLGNFGSTSTSGSSNPFYSTYFTSTSSDSLSQMESALEATTLGSMTGTGFSTTGSQEGCTTGSSTSTATNNSACAVNDTGIDETLSGNGVKYLLIGASTATNLNYDFFKLQDLEVTYSASATPEPATLSLLGLALVALAIFGRRRWQRS